MLMGITREQIEETDMYQQYLDFWLIQAQIMGLAIGVAVTYRKAVYGLIFDASVDVMLGGKVK